MWVSGGSAVNLSYAYALPQRNCRNLLIHFGFIGQQNFTLGHQMPETSYSNWYVSVCSHCLRMSFCWKK